MAIGIFDSGVGGLTVLRQIAARLPHEPIVYLGDTARVPYGTKSAETVIRYARGCADVLLSRGISLLVLACNTASAYALEALRESLSVPVLGVVEPGARRAVEVTRNGRVGVIGTAGTVASRAYQETIRALDPGITVHSQSCPLFVPLAEEGWVDGAIPREIARVYLRAFDGTGIDTLVLGCTHYPLLRGPIAEAAGPGVTLVDSAEATSAIVDQVVHGMGIATPPEAAPADPRIRYLVTDSPDTFARVGRRFLDREVEPIEWVNV